MLQDPSLLEGRVTLHQVKAGSVVARQGDQVRTAYKTVAISFLFHDTKNLMEELPHFHSSYPR